MILQEHRQDGFYYYDHRYVPHPTAIATAVPQPSLLAHTSPAISLPLTSQHSTDLAPSPIPPIQAASTTHPAAPLPIAITTAVPQPSLPAHTSPAISLPSASQHTTDLSPSPILPIQAASTTPPAAPLPSPKALPLQLPPLSRLRKSSDLRNWFTRATADDRIAMDERMTEQWQLTMEDRRAEDEEEMARRKRHKTEGAANRKRVERGKKVRADIAAGQRTADGKLIKKVCCFSRFARSLPS